MHMIINKYKYSNVGEENVFPVAMSGALFSHILWRPIFIKINKLIIFLSSSISTFNSNLVNNCSSLCHLIPLICMQFF